MKRARHECRYPGCHELTTDRYCEKHKVKQDNTRLSAHARGYTSKWDKARKVFLAEHPTCECAECKAQAEVEKKNEKPMSQKMFKVI